MERRNGAWVLEDASRTAVEVVTLWKETVLRVDVLGPQRRSLGEFRVGEGRGCDVAVPREALGGLDAVPIVRRDQAGTTIAVPAGASGEVVAADGQRESIGQLEARGFVFASDGAEGCACFRLPDDGRAIVDVGSLTFLVRVIARPRKSRAGFKLDWSRQTFGGASIAAHALVVFIAFFDVPGLLSLSIDPGDDARRGVKYTPYEQPEKKEIAVDERREEASPGKRHADEEGQAGARDAQKTRNKMGVQGPKNNPRPQLAMFTARDAGILSVLPANAVMSPFGGEQALGADPENVLGAILGDTIGPNFGYGGLGIKGTGRGGGGDGRGTLGVGDFDTIGHDKYGRKHQYGLPDPRFAPQRVGKSPTPRPGMATVKGSLSKDTIRRVVQRHLNEVKYCYEGELAKRPDLSGRVAVRFVIDGTGGVAAASISESTVGSRAVESCIALAVRRWSFPQPQDGGFVFVTYPFQLESSAE